MKQLTKNQIAQIEKVTKAYLNNYTPIKIARSLYSKAFIVYDMKEYEKNKINPDLSYLYIADNIDNLKGFLYGMIKGRHSKHLQIEKTIDLKKESEFLKTFEL